MDISRLNELQQLNFVMQGIATILNTQVQWTDQAIRDANGVTDLNIAKMNVVLDKILDEIEEIVDSVET